MSIFRKILFCLTLGCLLTAPGVSADSILNIFTENYPPYNMSISGASFAHKEEDITGLCTDMVVALMKKAKVDYRLKLRNWSTSLKRAKTKPNHAIFCAVRTKERDPFFHWVGPVAQIEWTLFAKAGTPIKLKRLNDAKKYRIGGYKDDVMSDYLLERGFEVSTMANDSLNPRRLVLGQIDLWVTDGLSGPYVASEAENITDLEPVLTFNSTGLYLAVNIQSDKAILNKLDSGFKSLMDSGEAEAISKPYRP